MNGLKKGRAYFRLKAIEKELAEKKKFYVERAYEEKNDFWGAFFEFSVENAFADIFEKKFKVIAYKTNDFDGDKYFKIMSFIHFTQFMENRPWAKEGYAVFKRIFVPLGNEKQLFNLLFRCLNEYKDEFNLLRNLALIRYGFGLNERDNIMDFADGFCYNSYNEFYMTFNRFMTVERRLEIAK